MSFFDSLRFRAKRTQVESMCRDVLELQPDYLRLFWYCYPKLFDYLLKQSVVKPVESIEVFDIRRVTDVRNASEIQSFSKYGQLSEAYVRSLDDNFFSDKAVAEIEELKDFLSSNYGWPQGRDPLEIFECYRCRAILRWQNKANEMQFFRLWRLCTRLNRPFEIRAIKRTFEFNRQVLPEFLSSEHFLIPASLADRWVSLVGFLNVPATLPLAQIKLADNASYAILPVPAGHPLCKFLLEKEVASINSELLHWDEHSQQCGISGL